MFSEEMAELAKKPNEDNDKDSLKDFVTNFLKKYSKIIKGLRSPLSSVLAREANECVDQIEEIDKFKSPEQSEEFSKLLAHVIKLKFN